MVFVAKEADIPFVYGLTGCRYTLEYIRWFVAARLVGVGAGSCILARPVTDLGRAAVEPYLVQWEGDKIWVDYFRGSMLELREYLKLAGETWGLNRVVAIGFDRGLSGDPSPRSFDATRFMEKT